jgi:hypothetical protein
MEAAGIIAVVHAIEITTATTKAMAIITGIEIMAGMEETTILKTRPLALARRVKFQNPRAGVLELFEILAFPHCN